MTELQKQVSLLRKSNAVISSSKSLSSGKPSLFLTPAEAASIDTTTVYEAAIVGLDTLCQYDDRFERFRSKLLHPSSVDLQRELKTVEENKILDLEINALLSMLSLFGSEQSCHVILEYLIRRYNINDMNTDALIKSMLVVHDSKIFAKIVQLCSLEGTNWEFLNGVKEHGVPLPKSVLVKQCFKSDTLLDILCHVTQTAIKLTVAKQSNSVGQSIEMLYNGSLKVLTLFCSVVSDMSEEKAFDDMKMRQIYNFIVSGLVSEIVETKRHYTKHDILHQWKRASCRIIVQILKKTPIAKPLVKSLSNSLAEAFSKECVHFEENESIPDSSRRGGKNNDNTVSVRLEIILCLVVMAQSQKLLISSSFLKHIFSDQKSNSVETIKDSIFINDLKYINSKYDTSHLVILLVKEIMKKVIINVSENEMEVKSDNSYLFQIIKSIMINKLLSEHTSKIIIEAVYDKIILNIVLTYSNEVEELVQFYSQYFPIQFDNCTEDIIKKAKEFDLSNVTNSDEDSQFAVVNNYLSVVFNKMKYKIPNNDGLGIFVSLNSSISQIRIQALNICSENKSLISNMEIGPDLMGLIQSIYRNMTDEDYSVASAAWNYNIVEGILSQVDASELFIVVQTAINTWSNYFINTSRKRGTKLFNAIFKVISNAKICEKLIQNLDDEKIDWIIFTLMKFVFGTLSLKYNEIHSKTSAEDNKDIRIESMERSAYECLRSIGTIYTNNDHICKNIPVIDNKSTDKTVSCEEYLISSLIRTNDAINESLIQKLILLISQTHHQVVETSDITVALSVLKLTVSLDLNPMKKNYIPQFIIEFIYSLTSLLLLCVNKLSSYGSEYYFRGKLLNHLVDFCKSVSKISKDASSSLGKLFDLVANDSLVFIKTCLIIEVMNSLDNAVRENTESVINMLFPISSNEFLFYIIFNQDDENRNSVLFSSYNNLFIRTTLSTKLTAIKIITSRLHAIGESKSNKNKDDNFSVFVSYLIPALLATCSSASEELRKDGIALSEVVKSLDNKLFSIVKSNKSDKNKEISSQEIITVCEIIFENQSVIRKDCNALYISIKNDLFESNDSKRKTDVGNTPLFKHFIWILSSFSYRYPMVSQIILKMIASQSIEQYWLCLQTLITDIIELKHFNVKYERLVDDIFSTMSTIAESSNHNFHYEIVQWFCTFFEKEKVVNIDGKFVNSVALEIIKQKIINLVNANVFDSLVDATKILLLEVIIKEYTENPGRNNLMDAILLLSSSLPFLCFAKLLYRGVRLIETSFSQIASNTITTNHNMEIEEEEEEGESLVSGMSTQLNSFSNLLEIINAVVIKYSSINNNREISAGMNMVIDLFFSINHASLNSLLNVEYHKAIIVTFIQTCFDKIGTNYITSSSSNNNKESIKGNKSKNKKIAKDNTNSFTIMIDGEDCPLYSVNRTESDISKFIHSLINVQICQVQIATLNIIEILLISNPSAIANTIDQIGSLLSTLTMSSNFNNKEELIESILRTFVRFLYKKSTPVDWEKLLPQDILEPLCENFQGLPSVRRSKLIKIALQEMNDISALTATVSILLIHSYVSNETTQDNTVDTITTSDESSSLLILSKAAHRKAHKESIASTSEEFFKQSIDIVLSSTSALDNIAVCIEIFKVSQLLLEESVLVEQRLNNNADIQKSTNVKLDMKKLQGYCYKLMRTKKSDDYFVDNNNRRGNAVTLTILHLEFILELLESKTFHRHLANLDDAQIVQNHFLELADSVLRLLAFSSEVENGFQSNNRVQSLLVKFENKEYRTTPQYIGKNISGWCHETLDTIQKLVDIPSFITILQELINHDLPAVRQKAILILGDRLESLTSKRSGQVSETTLFLDLNSNLRKTIKENLKTKKNKITIDNVVSAGLVQTALMCQDVLAKHLGSSDEWMEELSQTLSENLDISKNIIESLTLVKDVELLCESFKILGSTFLCAGTIVTVLGPRSLGLLATLMKNLFSSMDEVMKPVNEADEESRDSLTLLRTKSLLIRTSLSTFTSIAAYLSSFFHPYIEKTLILSLTLQSNDNQYDSNSIHQDIDKLLTVIASKIPPRLSMPTFLKSTPKLLSLNSQHAIIRYADLLSEVWLNLDRPTVISQLQELTTVSTMILDYRRLYGDQSLLCSSVDKALSEAIVELCLKLTEIELRNYLLRLCEWRDDLVNANIEIENNNDKQIEKFKTHSRSVTFYTVIESLNERLKSIFVPSMSIVWTNSVEKLNLFVSIGNAKNSVMNYVNDDANASSKKKKKNKKRSSEEFIDDSARDELIGELKELSFVSIHILNGVKDSCLNDREGFIDESRYEVMMPPVAALIELRNAFLSDQLFLEFCNTYVTPCLSALALAVGKDILWKPLNHKLLMATRSRVTAIRIAAIDAIHELFKTIGEEYLLLLPESLPFLSELMEDDSQDVVHHTIAAIRFIEELSGEKLDTYLQ